MKRKGQSIQTNIIQQNWTVNIAYNPAKCFTIIPNKNAIHDRIIITYATYNAILMSNSCYVE